MIRTLAAWCSVVLVAGVAGACGDPTRGHGRAAVSPGNVEQVWLDRVGGGATRTAATCARGAADPVARAFCTSPAPALAGLPDLYRALGIRPGDTGVVAVATHSLGLSARTVSALNPRVLVFPRYSPLDENGIVAAAFSRGEPFVEMVGYDPTARDFNFYLLVFEPAADLLSERVERGWKGWTLYSERDLEDTPLDCTSCHRPDGPGAPRRLLMRQFDGPWMHWGDFRGITPPTNCLDDSGMVVRLEGTIPSDGAELLRQVDGPDGRHGGIAVADLVVAPSGYDLSNFLFYAAGLIDGPGDVPCNLPDCPFSEPLPFTSQGVLCDRLLHGRADGAGGTWARYRQVARAQGFTAPYFDPDLLDATVRASVAADFGAFVASGADDAFSKLSGLISPDVGRAIGFLPDDGDGADVMLATMCGRCHNPSTDPRLTRSRFDAFALDRLDATMAREITRRISLPRTSPERMPPLRAGELSSWAIDRITAFVQANGDRDSDVALSVELAGVR